MLRRQYLKGSIVLGLLMAWISGVQAQPYLYWSVGGGLYRMPVDLQSPSELVAPGMGSPYALAVDGAAGMVYWTENSVVDGGWRKAIRRAPFGSKDLETLFDEPEEPVALALDVDHQRICWSTREPAQIKCAGLDFQEVTAFPTEGVVRTLAIDPVTEDLYGLKIESFGWWRESHAGTLSRWNTAGDETPIPLHDSTGAEVAIQTFSLDVAQRNLYYGYFTTGSSEVMVSALDGTRSRFFGTATERSTHLAYHPGEEVLYALANYEHWQALYRADQNGVFQRVESHSYRINSPTAFAIDPVQQRALWTRYSIDESRGRIGHGEIRAMDLALDSVVTAVQGHDPIRLAYDAVNQELLWDEYNFDERSVLKRADLNGNVRGRHWGAGIVKHLQVVGARLCITEKSGNWVYGLHCGDPAWGYTPPRLNAIYDRGYVRAFTFDETGEHLYINAGLDLYQYEFESVDPLTPLTKLQEGVGRLSNMVYSPGTNTLYWVNESVGQIESYTLGLNIQQPLGLSVNPQSETIFPPYRPLAIDIEHETLYWEDEGKVWVAGTDGTGKQMVLNHPVSGMVVVGAQNVVGGTDEVQERSAVSIYPVPFKQHTKIKVQQHESGPVKIVAYDLLGRPMATIFDSVLPAGVHQFTIKGQDWPAGVYLVQVSSPSGKNTRSIIRLP